MFSLGKGKSRRTGTDPGVLAGAGSLLRNYHVLLQHQKPQSRGGVCAPPTSPPGFVPEEEAVGLSGFQNLFKD